MAERPRSSPVPDYPPDLAEEPITGVYPATRDFAREVARSGVFKVAIGVGGFALSCFLAGITVTKAMAQSARDAGVEAAALVKREADTTQAELERFQREAAGRFERLEGGQNRSEQKLDALLTRLQVPNPAPMPKDGGP